MIYSFSDRKSANVSYRKERENQMIRIEIQNFSLTMGRVILFIFLTISQLSAQFDHQDVFEDKEGSELLSLLVENYKPVSVLDYSQARDTMFSKIYNIDDTVSCIYSDHKLYLPPGEDPTTALYMNGIADGINTEHTYPQSKGAEFGNARSDMHHLFPSRVSANEERGSFPFAEINDNVTIKWFYKTIETENKPNNQIIDLYSEKGVSSWEPRESVKGDVARAIFYFYTMYKNQADQADALFFENQKEILCDWHYSDPVDSLEWHRNWIKAQYQSDKPNPYILDCSLASRAFCGSISDECAIVHTTIPDSQKLIECHPNPVIQNIELQIKTHSSNLSYEIIHISSGKRVLTGKILPYTEYQKIDVHFGLAFQ